MSGEIGYIDTNSAFTANSDHLVPSQKAVKTALSTYVPYSSATGNVNLNGKNLTNVNTAGSQILQQNDYSGASTEQFQVSAVTGGSGFVEPYFTFTDDQGTIATLSFAATGISGQTLTWPETSGALATISDINNHVSNSHTFVPVTGATIGVLGFDPRTIYGFIQPAGTLANLTINFNPGGSDGQTQTWNTTQILTTLTCTGVGGASVAGAPITLGVEGFFSMSWTSSDNTWHRTG